MGKESPVFNRSITQMDTETNPFKNITAEAQRARNNLCDPCVFGTNSDPNFVTFVLFVVTRSTHRQAQGGEGTRTTGLRVILRRLEG